MKLLEFNKLFLDEASCNKYLHDFREKQGVVCSECGCTHQYWDKYNKRWTCTKCYHHTSLRSCTVMQGSNLPLIYWFTAIHVLVSTKKTFSASEMQRQLGHKRYQPIWEMMHKLRSVMGERDSKYQLMKSVELDKGYFTSENLDRSQSDMPLKSGIGSQRKSKVLVMVESEDIIPTEKGQRDKKVDHIKKNVISDLSSSIIKKEAEMAIDANATLKMDASTSYNKLTQTFEKVEKKVVKPKDASKILPWVHVAIYNAKSLILDMYHGIKDQFPQSYLDEFYYKFNRQYFGDRLFDRLMVASVTYTPTFKHKLYGMKETPNCG